MSRPRGNGHLLEWDRAFLQTNEQAEATLFHMLETYRQGPDEVVRESALLSRSWNFELSGIQIPIYAFHGDADTMPSMIWQQLFPIYQMVN